VLQFMNISLNLS